MAEAVFLTQETYDRIINVIQSIEKGDFIRVRPSCPVRIVETDENGEVTLDKNNAETTDGTGGSVDVAITDIGDFAEGETEVDTVSRISFSPLFKIHDNGGGEVVVDLKTEECACDDTSVDGGAA